LSDRTEMRDPTGQFILGPEYAPPNKNRFVVEVPDKFATARWSRDADIVTIARCMLATLKYEPHAADTVVLRRVLEGVIEGTQRERGGEVRPDTGRGGTTIQPTRSHVAK
jgi:hypothetical protein